MSVPSATTTVVSVAAVLAGCATPLPSVVVERGWPADAPLDVAWAREPGP